MLWVQWSSRQALSFFQVNKSSQFCSGNNRLRLWSRASPAPSKPPLSSASEASTRGLFFTFNLGNFSFLRFCVWVTAMRMKILWSCLSTVFSRQIEWTCNSVGLFFTAYKGNFSSLRIFAFGLSSRTMGKGFKTLRQGRAEGHDFQTNVKIKQTDDASDNVCLSSSKIMFSCVCASIDMHVDVHVWIL